MQKNQAPLWVTKFLRYTENLGGSLHTRYGFSEKEIGVYLFLFTRKLFSNESRFNSYAIGKELNKISDEYMDEDYRINYREKAVSESLNKLESKGFVTKCNNVDISKLKGRKPIAEYETKNIHDVTEYIRKKLDEKRDQKLDLLATLEDIEENVGLGNNKGKSEENE